MKEASPGHLSLLDSCVGILMVMQLWDRQEPLEFSLIQMVPLSTGLTAFLLQMKAMEVDTEERPKELVRKPYVLKGGCWLHSSRSPSCTYRARKGPEMSSFYRWRNRDSEGRKEFVWGSQN